MGNETHRYKASEEHKVMLKKYEKTTKLRSCLKCNQLFKSLHSGNRICEDKVGHSMRDGYARVVYTASTWGDCSPASTAESSLVCSMASIETTTSKKVLWEK